MTETIEQYIDRTSAIKATVDEVRVWAVGPCLYAIRHTGTDVGEQLAAHHRRLLDSEHLASPPQLAPRVLPDLAWPEPDAWGYSALWVRIADSPKPVGLTSVEAAAAEAIAKGE